MALLVAREIYLVIYLYFAHFGFDLSEGVYTETNWQSSAHVSEYKSYSSITLVHYHVPAQSTLSSWIFNTIKSSAECEDRTVHVSIQYSSYPVISPLNETFPANFIVQRSYQTELTIQPDVAVVTYNINNPMPGSWFAGAFLGDYVDDSITQKGFQTTCSYYMGGSQVLEAVETIPDLAAGVFNPLNVSFNTPSLYRFLTTEQTWSYTVEVHQCTYDQPDGTDDAAFASRRACPLRFVTRGLALPHWDGSHSNLCNCLEFPEDNSTCGLEVQAVETNAWHYIALQADLIGSISFSLYINFSECSRYPQDEQSSGGRTELESRHPVIQDFPDTWQPPDSNSSSESNATHPIPISYHQLGEFQNSSIPEPTVPPQSTVTPKNISDFPHFDTCTRIPDLGRYEVATRPFQVQYSLRFGAVPIPNRIYVLEGEPVIMKAVVRPMQDIGGTLKYEAELVLTGWENLDQLVEVHTCIQKASMPVATATVACPPDRYRVINNTSAGKSSVLYFPYPEPGAWYVSMHAKCFGLENVTGASLPVPEPCVDMALVEFSLVIHPCVNGGCGGYGSCREYRTGTLHYSSCKCRANYRGYGCSDSSVALTDAQQLTATLLLTLSNLLFLPAITVALYRRFYIEALSYFYTMFFSTFYHACDGDRNFIYCIMPYNVLAHCDFFGAIMSFWVTLVAMARIPEKLRGFLYVLAGLGLAVGVEWDRHSLWTFLVPSAVALIIMFVSWVTQCHSRRACYPSLRRWLLLLLPGVLIALVGLFTFALLETEANYQYTHSAWHACMALTIVFVLPPRKPTKSVPCEISDEGNPTSLVCCCTDNTLEGATSYALAQGDLSSETGGCARDEPLTDGVACYTVFQGEPPPAETGSFLKGETNQAFTSPV